MRAELEEKESRPARSHPAETEELINLAQELEGSDEDVDSPVDLKLEEEQKEASVLLTGQDESVEKQTSANGDETEEENEERGEVDEGQSEANASCCDESVSCPMNL